MDRVHRVLLTFLLGGAIPAGAEPVALPIPDPAPFYVTPHDLDTRAAGDVRKVRPLPRPTTFPEAESGKCCSEVQTRQVGRSRRDERAC